MRHQTLEVLGPQFGDVDVDAVFPDRKYLGPAAGGCGSMRAGRAGTLLLLLRASSKASASAAVILPSAIMFKILRRSSDMV
jgi:hypothetical protein